MNKNSKHKVFISYYHNADQNFKDALVEKYEGDVFIDASVDTGDIDDSKTDEEIRTIIRDEYLKDSTVTIVLVSEETKKRKHVDWEIFSSMYNGLVNKKSGILIINTSNNHQNRVSIDDNDKHLFPSNINWGTMSDYKKYDYLPERLLDNLKKEGVKINIVNYNDIINNQSALEGFIDIAHNNRTSNEYDLSREMKRANS